MLKRNKIIFAAACSVLLMICGCSTVPEGTPPERVVQIRPSAENGEPVSINEALNLMSTELAVNVFSKFKGELNVLFKNNSEGNDITRRLYRELKMFLPLRSVLTNYSFIIESSFRKSADNVKVWNLRLIDDSGKILWNGSVNVKNEAENE